MTAETGRRTAGIGRGIGLNVSPTIDRKVIAARIPCAGRIHVGSSGGARSSALAARPRKPSGSLDTTITPIAFPLPGCGGALSAT
ncbi:MAG: hypothetical protein J2P13_10100 [Acidobacteria bacterium]|nr:hypothetical protein [Acidobacteriota bacterium]